MNPHDDGIGIDEYVDWLIEAGHPIERIDDFGEWVRQFEARLHALPDHQRQGSVLQMLKILQDHGWDGQPPEPVRGQWHRQTVFTRPSGRRKSVPTTIFRRYRRRSSQNMRVTFNCMGCFNVR